MFVKIRTNKGSKRRSVLICHNIRVDVKIRQLTVKTLGHSENNSLLNQWIVEAKQWIKENGSQWKSETLPIKKRQASMNKSASLFNIKEEKRINVGVEDVFGKLYNELGFQDLLSPSHQKTLRQIIFARILEPGSKRRLSEISEKKLDEELPLDRIYRMMDSLIKDSDLVQKKVFEATETALEKKVSLVLFDVTTLSFESISEDGLRAFGFSKDFKFNTTQVTLALATTQEGLPIGYRLFPGNTAESKTLIAAINGWKKHISIDEVTIIGDRAMMSDANLSALELAGYRYVIAFPLRKLSKEKQKLILDKTGYTENKADDEINCYRIIDLEDRRLFISYSSKRAAKDAKDRERLVNKLKNKLESCKNVKRLINKNGYLKYSEITGQATAIINEEKIIEDAKWDGLHAVITNQPLCDVNIYNSYRRLWVIEESFRINKHNLKMRPIYHFTPQRIQAHILICYMVFTLIRHLQFRLQRVEQSMSVNRIIDAVRDIQASILVDGTNQNKYRMLSPLTTDGKIIYKALSIEQGLTLMRVT
jgi:transposase